MIYNVFIQVLYSSWIITDVELITTVFSVMLQVQ
jgi:hypothetical protein